MDLIVMGYILNEIIKYPHEVIGPVLGSPAAYTSIAASRLGLKVGLVSKCGPDFPREFIMEFEKAGVDLFGLNRNDITTTNYLIYDEQGRKRIEYIKRASPIRFEDIPSGYLKDCKMIYVCPMDFEVPTETIRKLRNYVRLLSADLGGYGGATSTSKHSLSEILQEYVSYFDIVKASLEDCVHLFGFDKEDSLPLLASGSFINAGASIAIITLGGEGALIRLKDGSAHHVKAFKSNVKDVTGAGDVFMAGFLTGFIRTGDALRSVLYGNAVASLVISRSGGAKAERMPTLSEVMNLIENTDISEFFKRY